VKARDKPFATERVLRLRYRVESWPALLDRLAALNYRAAIVGPEGSGKTTLLEDSAPRLEERGFAVLRLFVNRDNRTCRPAVFGALRTNVTSSTIVLLDGAEQLSVLQWLRVRLITRRAAGLVITSHRPGLLPTLMECRTSPELLGGLMHELLATRLNRTQPVRPPCSASTTGICAMCCARSTMKRPRLGQSSTT
jgi:hypothetical protein